MGKAGNWVIVAPGQNTSHSSNNLVCYFTKSVNNNLVTFHSLDFALYTNLAFNNAEDIYIMDSNSLKARESARC